MEVSKNCEITLHFLVSQSPRVNEPANTFIPKSNHRHIPLLKKKKKKKDKEFFVSLRSQTTSSLYNEEKEKQSVYKFQEKRTESTEQQHCRGRTVAKQSQLTGVQVIANNTAGVQPTSSTFIAANNRWGNPNTVAEVRPPPPPPLSSLNKLLVGKTTTEILVS